MGFMEAVRTAVMHRYADFQGRSRRMEYWMFQLLNVLITLVGVVLLVASGFSLEQLMTMEETGEFPDIGALGWVGLAIIVLWSLFVLIPNIAVVIRRLHDRDMSGWWYLGLVIAGIIPLVGWLASLALLVLMLLPGTDGENRFGPDPKGVGLASEIYD